MLDQKTMPDIVVDTRKYTHTLTCTHTHAHNWINMRWLKQQQTFAHCKVVVCYSKDREMKQFCVAGNEAVLC